MCMGGPQVTAPAAPIVPESVKRVSKDQRRMTADNTAASIGNAKSTNPTGLGILGGQAPKKSLLGA
jgi:hypothetical protein